MHAVDWDPTRYEQFRALRSRPFWDLAGLLDPDREVRSIVDLGCGTGELTAELGRRLGAVRVLGLDSSTAMLDQADGHADGLVEFQQADIATWDGEGERFDLVVANASLQWVEDHPAVLARWAQALEPGGQLAVQVPANGDHPSHTCSVAVGRREPYFSALGGDPPPDPVTANVLAPEAYSELLFSLGFDDPHVRLQVYPQVMESSAAVVDWVSGTSLRRFLTRLPEELHQPFVDDYRAELLAELGDHAPYFYTFKRILIHARAA